LTDNEEQQEEAPKKLTEHSKTEFLAFPLKVIVSPFKVFKDIAKNPDFKGIILIAGLVVLATACETYLSSSKVFLSIDGTPTSFLNSSMFSGFIVSVLTQSVLLFAFNWLIYAGVLFLVMRVFGQKGGAWRPFFILVGYAFSIMIVQWAVSAVLFATLPEIHFSNLSTWPPSTQTEVDIANEGIQRFWISTPAYQTLFYLINSLVNIIDIWLVILSVMIVHAFDEVTWGKAAMISVTAFILRFFLKIFVGF
jgi:hypothetical protein